jgi:hypothetical protein
MIPTITNSCVLLRPYPAVAAAEGAAEGGERRRGSRGRREKKREEGGVHEEIARPDGGLNCARGPIPFT